jgi:hypothetical protein
MNLLGVMCWLSGDTTEGAETKSSRVRRARSGEELTGRKADFSFPIHSACAAPMMRTGALREILVCSRDHFAGDPAQRGVAADSTPGNCSAT